MFGVRGIWIWEGIGQIGVRRGQTGVGRGCERSQSDKEKFLEVVEQPSVA